MKLLALLGLVLVAAGCDNRPRGVAAGESATAAVPAAMDRRSDAVFVSGGEGAFSLANLKGQVVLLDFWATWSPAATSAVPELNRLYSDYQGHGLAVVGMAMDDGPLAEVTANVQAVGPRYPVVSSPRDVARRFGPVRAVPTRYLLDRKGSLRAQFPGHVDIAMIRESIDSLLAEP